MDSGEEAALIARSRAGDMRAFGALVDAHQNAVRAFLRRLTGNSADSDDLSQDAFARTWEVLHRFAASRSNIGGADGAPRAAASCARLLMLISPIPRPKRPEMW